MILLVSYYLFGFFILFRDPLVRRVGKSDNWIPGHIRKNATIKARASKESNGRWTVNGSVLGEMEPWMWNY